MSCTTAVTSYTQTVCNQPMHLSKVVGKQHTKRTGLWCAIVWGEMITFGQERDNATVQNNKSFQYKANWTDLEVETVEQLGDECEGREEDLQGIDVCSMSLTQLNSGLQQRRHKTINISSYWKVIITTSNIFLLLLSVVVSELPVITNLEQLCQR